MRVIVAQLPATLRRFEPAAAHAGRRRVPHSGAAVRTIRARARDAPGTTRATVARWSARGAGLRPAQGAAAPARSSRPRRRPRVSECPAGRGVTLRARARDAGGHETSATEAGRGAEVTVDPDRKSTRLNSSHI